MKISTWFALGLLCVSGGVALAKPCLTGPAEGETDARVLDFDPVMIKALRTTPGGTEGPADGLDDLLKLPAFNALVRKHQLKLFSGPMLGDVTPDGVRIWCRTLGPAAIQVRSGEHVSGVVKTTAANDYVAVLALDGLSPDTEYTYELLVNGQNVLSDPPTFRTAPLLGPFLPGVAQKPVKFDIAFGACSRYVPRHEHVWSSIAETKPLAFLMLGDNLYIDCHDPGVHRLMYYRRHLNQHFQTLTSRVPVYGTYDDHDFGMNDSVGGADPWSPQWKVDAWSVFNENWANPEHQGGDLPGYWSKFSLGDVDVFLLDTRYYRTKPGKDEQDRPGTDFTMLGPEQLAWLKTEFANSKATFKILCSGTAWHEYADKGGKDSWQAYAHEREQIWDVVREHQIGGVLLLSGDRHRTSLWKLKSEVGYPLYEFVSAKLTNVHTHAIRRQALYSYNQGRFYGRLSFDFTKPDPSVVLSAVSDQNETIFRFELNQSHLDFSPENDPFDPVAHASTLNPDFEWVDALKPESASGQ